jgi:hypothetical protein
MTFTSEARINRKKASLGGCFLSDSKLAIPTNSTVDERPAAATSAERFLDWVTTKSVANRALREITTADRR